MSGYGTIKCENCGTRRGLVEELWTADGRKPLLCEECAESVRALEAEADTLAELPSCEARQRIIDRAESTEGLVNALRAHDMIQCAACASTARTVADDRLYCNPAAVCCEGERVAALA
jgi:hypothetical protein